MKRGIDWIDALAARLWRRGERSAENDGPSLALFRLLWGGFVVLFHAPYSTWVGHAPQGFFSPPWLSMASWFEGFPARWVFVAVDVAMVLAVVAVTLGVFARAAALAYVALATFSAGFQNAFGKIDHESLFLGVTACLAFTNWSTRLAWRADRSVAIRTEARALAAAAFVLAWGMFTAGFDKALAWIDLDLGTSGFLSWYNTGYFVLGRTYLAAPWVMSLPPWVFEVFDYAAVAFELSGLVMLWAGRRSWHGWLLTACCFHLGNTFLLNIPFPAHMPLYLCFVRWPERLRRWIVQAGRMGQTRLSRGIASGLVGAALVHVLQRLGGEGSRFLFITDRVWEIPVRVHVCAVLWIGCAIFVAQGLRGLRGAVATGVIATPGDRTVAARA